MRIGQVIRYFSPAPRAGVGSEEQTSRDTSEDTCNQDRYRPGDVEEAEESHRHYDSRAAGVEPGITFQAPEHGYARLIRRRNTNLAVPRSGDFVPVAGSREPFYEKRLLEGLPWHCKCGAETVPAGAGRQRPQKRWRFHCALPPGTGLSDAQQEALGFSMLDRELEGWPGFEVFWREIERSFADAGAACQC